VQGDVKGEPPLVNAEKGFGKGKVPGTRYGQKFGDTLQNPQGNGRK
jgi:hypothetical protein